MAKGLVVVFLFVVSFFPSSIFASSSDCQTRWQQVMAHQPLPDKYRSLMNLCDQELETAMAKLIGTNITFTYQKARDFMFTVLDYDNGHTCSVYDSTCYQVRGMPDEKVLNCEHTWPQSLGAVGLAKVDLHHLFPVSSESNTRRSNNPFCEVDKVTWQSDESKLGAYGEVVCFEPPMRHRGDVARAMFYFAVRYHKAIDPMQEKFLRQWNIEDPVTSEEEGRNDHINQFQKNRNPFIDYPSFAELITDF
ncbi:MAG: endonuclease [Pseudomonadota bacterium]